MELRRYWVDYDIWVFVRPEDDSQFRLHRTLHRLSIGLWYLAGQNRVCRPK